MLGGSIFPKYPNTRRLRMDRVLAPLGSVWKRHRGRVVRALCRGRHLSATCFPASQIDAGCLGGRCLTRPASLNNTDSISHLSDSRQRVVASPLRCRRILGCAQGEGRTGPPACVTAPAPQTPQRQCWKVIRPLDSGDPVSIQVSLTCRASDRAPAPARRPEPSSQEPPATHGRTRVGTRATRSASHS